MTATIEKYNDLQQAKRLMFAMRNGIVADALRKGGCPFRIIFGVNIPQLKEIAAQLPPSGTLAEALWANSTTRESMLLAPMIMPRDTFTSEDARRWCETIPACEVADVLCHSLLRHCTFALDLAESLARSDDPMLRYTGLRLAFNLVRISPEDIHKIALHALESPLESYPDRLAVSLAEEARFYLEGWHAES